MLRPLRLDVQHSLVVDSVPSWDRPAQSLGALQRLFISLLDPTNAIPALHIASNWRAAKDGPETVLVFDLSNENPYQDCAVWREVDSDFFVVPGGSGGIVDEDDAFFGMETGATGAGILLFWPDKQAPMIAMYCQCWAVFIVGVRRTCLQALASLPYPRGRRVQDKVDLCF